MWAVWNDLRARACRAWVHRLFWPCLLRQKRGFAKAKSAMQRHTIHNTSVFHILHFRVNYEHTYRARSSQSNYILSTKYRNPITFQLSFVLCPVAYGSKARNSLPLIGISNSKRYVIQTQGNHAAFKTTPYNSSCVSSALAASVVVSFASSAGSGEASASLASGSAGFSASTSST